jgi:Zn-dependent protease
LKDLLMAGRRDLNLFRIGGIEIAIDASWLIVFALVLWSLSAGYFPLRYPGHSATDYWLTGLAATLLFFASILIHELAHSLVAKRLGQDVRRIPLFVFGGMTHLSAEPKNAAADFKIAVVGPLTSFLLGVMFFEVARALESMSAAPLTVAAFRYLAFINVALAVFNLLPGYPLDGGRLLRAFFWSRSGSLRGATARAADWGNGIAIGLMVLGAVEIFAGVLVGGLWLILIGMFLRGAARAGYYGVALEQALHDVYVRDVMTTEPVVIDAATTVADAVELYFLRRGFASFPVMSAGKVVGLVSLSHVQHCPAENRDQQRVSDIMQAADDSISVDPGTRLFKALRRMQAANIGRLLVVDHGRLRGLLSRSVVLRFVEVRSALQEG